MLREAKPLPGVIAVPVVTVAGVVFLLAILGYAAWVYSLEPPFTFVRSRIHKLTPLPLRRLKWRLQGR